MYLTKSRNGAKQVPKGFYNDAAHIGYRSDVTQVLMVVVLLR